jgi:hypothetical protein
MSAKVAKKLAVQTPPKPSPWRIHVFQRHRQDDPTQSVPARDFLRGCLIIFYASICSATARRRDIMRHIVMYTHVSVVSA